MGFLSHWLYFIKGEHHLQAPAYFKIALACSLYIITEYILGLCSTKDLLKTVFFSSSGLCALVSSIVVYRVYFHRTRDFPGPKLAAISKLWHSWKARHSKNYLVLEEWYHQYGTFVRTGPNEITVFHADALDALHGARSQCSKTDWYDVLRPHVAVNTTRSKEEHEERRKTWNPSFSRESLPNYDAIYKKHLNLLKTVIGEFEGRDTNVVDLVYHWSFDVMGEVMFSQSFDTLTASHSRNYLTTLRRFMALLGPCSPAPWLVNLGSSIPWIMKDWTSMFRMCEGYMKERIEQNGKECPDIASKVIQVSRARNSLEQDKYALSGDAVAMVIAGSDTLACTLVYALAQLAKDPRHQDIIIEELKAIGIMDPHDADEVQGLAYLNAFIKELLRVHSPVPTGSPRQTGPQGLTIAGRYIPPFTTVIAPRHIISRLPQNFSQPARFLPERWLPYGLGPESVHETGAYFPFGSGRYACIGRDLALRQARVFITVLVSSFKISLAKEENGISVDAAMKDEFTMVPGPLKLSFTKRKQDA